MNLNDIPIFIKVVEFMGISAAARALEMPKSKVSRRIAQLEEDLGVRLIERNTRTVKLTELGDVFYQRCLIMMEEVTSAKESVLQLKDVPQGRIKISASVSIGQHMLAPLIVKFQDMHPNIELDIHLTNRRVDLIAEGFDLVIRVGDLEDSSLISKCMLETRGSLFVSQGYLDKNGCPENLEQLEDFRLLAMSDQKKYNRWCLEDENGNQQHVSVKKSLTINDFTTLMRVCESGGGIALLPWPIAQSSYDKNLLVQVLSEYRTPKIAYFMLYPSFKGLTRRSRLFIDFVSSELNNKT